jgi:fatty acid desaturase
MTSEREQRRLFRRAVRSGRVPAGFDRERWLPEVRRRETLLRRGRPVQAAMWGLVIAMLVLVIVLGLLVPLPVLAWTGTTLLALSVVMALLLDRVWVRAAHSVRGLLAELEGSDRST